MTDYGTAIVASERLNLSRSPAAEIAAAAYDAQQRAGLERADFVVVAVTPGDLGPAEDVVRAALNLPLPPE